VLLKRLEQADLVIWSYPVYYMSVSGQYKRFIDLLYHAQVKEILKGKAAAILCSSIHFYDHTSQAMMRAVSQDLGMRLVGAYSAHMEELLKKSGRLRLSVHWREWSRKVATGEEDFSEFAPQRSIPELSELKWPIDKNNPSSTGKVAIVGDLSTNSNLKKMADSLVDAMGERVLIYDLAQADIRQGCLGCCRCGMENECVQDKLDGFRHLLDEEILGAETILFALDLNNRLFSWRFKQFWDRSFCHNHVPYYKGRKLGWLVAGDLTANPQVLEMIRGMDQFMECQPIGIASDERGAALCQRQLSQLMDASNRPFDENKIPPQLFSGIAGKLIFRDAIFGTMRLVFPMDHRYYKKNGRYNFPQKQWKARILVWLATPLLKLPPIRKGLQKNMISGMVRPYQKVLAKLAKES